MPTSVSNTKRFRARTSGFGVAIALMLCLGLLSAWSVNNLIQSSREVNHTHQVLETLESLVGKINEMESRVRGYLLTKESVFLRAYDQNTHEIQILSQNLQELTQDNPTQQRYFQTLAPWIRTRMAWADDLKQSYLQNGLQASLAKIERNHALSEQIRKLVNNMKIEERAQIEIRQRRMEEVALSTWILVGIGTFFALGLIFRSQALNRQAYQELFQAHQSLVASEEQLKLAKLAAEAANQAKSQFLANMSHELRTPLNAVIGYSEMLAEEAAEIHWQSGQADLLKIGQAGQELLGLINQILAISQMETGQMKLKLEEFELAPLLTALPPQLAPLLARNQNQFSLKLPPELGWMHSDPSKLRQILMQLLSNACKFTEQGQIELEVDNLNETLCFRVKDTGIGISPDYFKDLFLDFSQADPAASRKYGGTGLGLALSKRYCDLLKGTLEVHSQPGQGSVFSLTLARTYPGAHNRAV